MIENRKIGSFRKPLKILLTILKSRGFITARTTLNSDVYRPQKKLKMDGTKPTALRGGGFKAAKPGFSVSRIAWMEMAACTRWQIWRRRRIRQGRHERNQNEKTDVYDDFIAAAEGGLRINILRRKAAIQGGSNADGRRRGF